MLRGVDGPGSVAAVKTASVAYEHRLLLYPVAALSMSSTRVDGVLVVKASAD